MFAPHFQTLPRYLSVLLAKMSSAINKTMTFLGIILGEMPFFRYSSFF